MLIPLLKTIEESDNPSIGHPLLRKLGIEASVSELSTQINAFWSGEYPFRVPNGDQSKITDPLEWWRNIGKFDHSNLVSVSCDFAETLTTHHPSDVRLLDFFNPD